MSDCFKVPELEQCLLLNGEDLRSNNCPLWKLNIVPGSLIFLKVGHTVTLSHTRVQPIIYFSVQVEEYVTLHGSNAGDNSEYLPEEGFKGTGLSSK